MLLQHGRGVAQRARVRPVAARDDDRRVESETRLELCRAGGAGIEDHQPIMIAQRIERFAGFVGKDRVIASTDCGFGTFAGYGKIDPAVTWKKLANLRAGADLADGRIA